MKMSQPDEITEMLSEGWEIAGYSVALLAAGAHSHNILLRKGSMLNSVTIITQGENETGRIMNVIAPMPSQPERKGFFG